MKVLMTPHIDDFKTHESGIRRVIEAYFRYLPDYGVELVKSGEKFDLHAAHAGQLGREADISHLHGLYWTADYNANWEYYANSLVIESIRGALETTVPSSWVAETIQRDMRFSPHIVPHGIEHSEWTPEKHENYVLWNKNRRKDVCDPMPAIELAMARPNVELVTTFLPLGFSEKLPNVRGIGLRPHLVMKRYIQRAMVYLSTTKETFGIGVLEAMAAGVPVLGFDWGGNRDLIQHGVNGYLARVNDIQDLANGLDYCIRHRAMLGENAREIAKRWNWPDAVKQVANIYRLAMQSDPYAGKVSVVIPCYNYANYLERAVNSVLKQTLPAYEIIIVDDGSTDNTGEIGRALAEKHDTVWYMHQENAGVAHARNTGIEASHCEFVSCLDADDQIEPKFLEACVAALKDDRTLGIAYTGLMMLHEDGRLAMSEWPTQPDYDRHMMPRSLGDLKGSNQVPTCNVFRKEAWRRTGGYKQRYAPLGAGAEDAEFWTRIFSIGYGARKVSDSGLFLYSLGGAVSKPFRDGSISKDLLEPDWLAMHPWARDGIHPFASMATSVNPHSHPVRQYDRPDVSIIVPVGNGHQEIVKDALDSIEAQTFRNWEVIVVWDAQQERHPKDILSAYPYIKIVYTDMVQSKGAGTARNLGGSHARGAFLSFLDADDTYAPTYLEACIANWSENKTIGYTDYLSKTIVSEEGLAEWPQENIQSYIPKTQEALILGKSSDFDCERAQAQPSKQDFFHWCLVSIFIPKSWHDSIGGFDESMDTFEDVLYHWMLARMGYCYTRIPEPLVVYRMYTGNRREIASLYTDEGRQKARAMLQYAHDTLERIEKVACKKCPGGQKPKINVYAEMENIQQQEAAKMVDDNMKMCDYIGNPPGNTGNHHVVGMATRIRYGYRGGGTQFLVHRDDIAAQPQLFREMQSSVPAPTAPAPVTLPPVAVAPNTNPDINPNVNLNPTSPGENPNVMPNQSTVIPVGQDGIPEYIAPVVEEVEPVVTPIEATVPAPTPALVPDTAVAPPPVEAPTEIPVQTPTVEAGVESSIGLGGDGVAATQFMDSDMLDESGAIEAGQGGENTYVPPTIADPHEEVDLQAIPGITANIANEFKVRGLITKADIAKAGIEGLKLVPGIGEKRAEIILEALAQDARGGR